MDYILPIAQRTPSKKDRRQVLTDDFSRIWSNRWHLALRPRRQGYSGSVPGYFINTSGVVPASNKIDDLDWPLFAYSGAKRVVDALKPEKLDLRTVLQGLNARLAAYVAEPLMPSTTVVDYQSAVIKALTARGLLTVRSDVARTARAFTRRYLPSGAFPVAQSVPDELKAVQTTLLPHPLAAEASLPFARLCGVVVDHQLTKYVHERFYANSTPRSTGIATIAGTEALVAALLALLGSSLNLNCQYGLLRAHSLRDLFGFMAAEYNRTLPGDASVTAERLKALDDVLRARGVCAVTRALARGTTGWSARTRWFEGPAAAAPADWDAATLGVAGQWALHWATPRPVEWSAQSGSATPWLTLREWVTLMSKPPADMADGMVEAASMMGWSAPDRAPGAVFEAAIPNIVLTNGDSFHGDIQAVANGWAICVPEIDHAVSGPATWARANMAVNGDKPALTIMPVRASVVEVTTAGKAAPTGLTEGLPDEEAVAEAYALTLLPDHAYMGEDDAETATLAGLSRGTLASFLNADVVAASLAIRTHDGLWAAPDVQRAGKGEVTHSDTWDELVGKVEAMSKQLAPGATVTVSRTTLDAAFSLHDSYDAASLKTWTAGVLSLLSGAANPGAPPSVEPGDAARFRVRRRGAASASQSAAAFALRVALEVGEPRLLWWTPEGQPDAPPAREFIAVPTTSDAYPARNPAATVNDGPTASLTPSLLDIKAVSAVTELHAAYRYHALVRE